MRWLSASERFALWTQWSPSRPLHSSACFTSAIGWVIDTRRVATAALRAARSSIGSALSLTSAGRLRLPVRWSLEELAHSTAELDDMRYQIAAARQNARVRGVVVSRPVRRKV